MREGCLLFQTCKEQSDRFTFAKAQIENIFNRPRLACPACLQWGAPPPLDFGVASYHKIEVKNGINSNADPGTCQDQIEQVYLTPALLSDHLLNTVGNMNVAAPNIIMAIN